jgi:hypothetical protein
MDVFANCPGCGFRGRLPGALSGIQTIICPNCKMAVPVGEIRQRSGPTGDDTPLPIWVDGTPTARGESPPVRSEAPSLPAVPEPETYTGDYMKDEAARFAQYVATQLGELHKRRLVLAEAENRFESMTMEQKQGLFRAHSSVAAEHAKLNERESAVQAKETTLAAREADLLTREAEVALRESRVARSEARAADTDRRTAELRATIDQLDATRAALAEERAELTRSAEALACRAEALDKAELAMHRRFAELDELVS